MKVEFLDGPALADRLPQLIKRSTSLEIAMAYVKIRGIRTLLKSTDSLLKRNGSMRIVFGLSTRHSITDKDSAQVLFDLSKQNNVKVKKWNNCGFHPKLLIFHGNPTSIVVGSANLTEAAQSTNAEANILIEDPEPRILKDAEQFFSHYFDTAPILKRKDVEKYELRVAQKVDGTTYRDSKEDTLPSPMQRRHELLEIKPNKVWKIAPGEDACCWNEWVQAIDEDGEGIVALGWNHVGSLNTFKSKDELREAVRLAAKNIWDKNRNEKTKIGYVTNQLWTFKTGISKNDVFLVYSESRVLGIAEVIKPPRYLFNESGPISFAHQIRVKYRWYNQWPRKADQRIIDSLGKQGTLKLVNETWLWNYILQKVP
jgi:HKD family nuclease